MILGHILGVELGESQEIVAFCFLSNIDPGQFSGFVDSGDFLLGGFITFYKLCPLNGRSSLWL